MQRVHKIAVFLALTLFVVNACEEQNITNVVDRNGSVIGRVLPAEADIVVALWQDCEKRRTITDGEGYFGIYDVKPAVYEVRFEAPDGRANRIPDVEVKSGETSSLGNISFTDPSWPFWDYGPPDGAKQVDPALGSIYMISWVPLDSASLRSCVRIEPPVSGEWWYYCDFIGHTYVFTPDFQLTLSTVYTVTVLPDLRLDSGETWGNNFVFTFTTGEMRLKGTSWLVSFAPDQVSPIIDGDLVMLKYNCFLDSLTVEDAIRAEPHFDLDVELVAHGKSLVIGTADNLVTSTDYRIIITEELADVLGNTVGKEDTVEFSTIPFEVVNRQFPSSLTDLPPRLRGGLISYKYNMDIDQSTVENAVSIDPPADLRAFVWSSDSRYLKVDILEDLMPGTVYTLTIGSELATLDGGTVGEAEIIEFEVQPLMVTDYGFPYGSYSLDTLADPGEALDMRIRLNADVHADTFSLATTFEPEVGGFWFLEEDRYSGQTLRFFPTGYDKLLADHVYTVAIKGGIGLVGGIGFEEDVELRFVVRPVMIESLIPSPGALGVYPYQLISFLFNAKMDRASTEAAFLMTTWDGDQVEGSFLWRTIDDDKRMYFYPTEYLESGQTYEVTISTDAMDITGAHLKEEGYTFFKVR